MSSADPLTRARWQLAGRFSLLVAATFVAAGVAVDGYVRHARWQAFDATSALASTSLRESIRVLEPGGLSVDGAELREEVAELTATLGLAGIAVWDEKGRALAIVSRFSIPLGAFGPARETLGEGSETMVLWREPLGGTPRAGTLVIARRAGEIAASLASLRRALAMLTLPTWLASFAIGWFIAGRALRPVRASFVLQRTFMADASHELRTPLAIIRAHAETALAGRTSHRDGRAEAGRDPAADASLTTIVAASEELTRLLDDLLFLARADADAPPTQRLRFAFDELVEESVAWLVPLAHERGAALAFVGPADGAEIVVEADPDQLKRLVGLLVTNAVAHAGAVPIEVAVRRADGVAYLYVDDAGPGFASEVLPHAFDRFRRGVATQDGRIPGHGLGLAIARAIVAGHGGEVSLGRSPLGGARVTVALPTSAPRST